MSDKSSNYWIVAVGDETGKQKFEAFDYRGKYKSICEAYKYRVPSLKIGTIDTLIALSDELAKTDNMLATLSKKIKRVFDDTLKQEPGKMSSEQIHLLQQIGDENYHIEDDNGSISHTLMIGDHDNAMTPKDYLQNFLWNKHLYNELDSIEKFKDKLLAEFASTDEELRRFSTEFNEVKSQVTAHERKLNGSVLVRPISEYINPDDIIETQHLTTVLIAVPRAKQEEFLSTYMTIEETAKARHHEHTEPDKESKEATPKPSSLVETTTVVPGSALKVIGEDKLPNDEFDLFRVVLFKRTDMDTEKSSDVDASAPNVENYKTLCREHRWTIRPFKYDKDEKKHNSIVLADLINRRRAAWRYMLIWCESKFDSVFTAWMHCIAARVFVESILRYGVRANIMALVIKPLKGQDSKLRNVLDKIFGSETSKKQIDTGEIDMSSFGSTAQEDYPYVNVTVEFNDL